MTDTLMEIIGIFLAVLIMFIFPVVALASQHDEIAQTTVETAVSDFVNVISEKGKITQADYDKLIEKITATGNSFDVQIELQILDDNPERKSVASDIAMNIKANVKGETLHYSVHTEDITQKIQEQIKNNKEGVYNLKKDDYIVVTVKNTNRTVGTEFKNFFYSIVGKDVSTIGASSAALVTSTGKNESGVISGGRVEIKEEPDQWKDMVKVTYVTDPSIYPIDNWYLQSMKDVCKQYNEVLAQDLTQKVVSVEKGSQLSITSETPGLTSNTINTRFIRWMVPTRKYDI